MKQENNFLDDLFESAREQEPQLSYEKVTDRFLSSTSPTLLAIAKNWFSKNISLNSIFLVAVGIVSIALIWSSFSKKSSIENQQTKSIVTIGSSPSSISSEATVQIIQEEPNEISLVKAENNRELNIETLTENKIISQNAQPIFSEKEIIEPTQELIEISPKIETITSIKIEAPVQELKEIKTKNLATAKDNNTITEKQKTNPYIRNRRPIETTAVSPWVVGEGSTDPKWTIIKQQSPNYFLSEKELILQKMLDLNYLEKIFEKTDEDNFAPLTIVSNYYLDESKYIQYKEQRIRIIHEKIAPDFDPNSPHIYITRFKIKKNKAILKFKYNGYSIFIQLKKDGINWKYHKLKSQHNSSKNKIDITF